VGEPEPLHRPSPLGGRVAVPPNCDSGRSRVRSRLRLEPHAYRAPLRLWTRQEDFVGREALLERKAHPQRTLVGLELEGNETAGHGDPVYVGRRKVGVVTSGARSPVLKKNIALSRLAVQYQDLGTGVEVGKLDGLQKRIPATVVRFPFYDPEKTRPRS
jgi:glycine cleavage system T protein (aminomethyltransferase)